MRISSHIIPRPWTDLRSLYYLLAVAAYCVLAFSAGWLPSCPLRALTGIPCPFCGITRGSSWLVQGQIQEAWLSNILVPLLGLGVLMLAAYSLGCRLVAGYRLELDLDSRWRRRCWILAALLVMISWVVNLYRYL